MGCRSSMTLCRRRPVFSFCVSFGFLTFWLPWSHSNSVPLPVSSVLAFESWQATAAVVEDTCRPLPCTDVAPIFPLSTSTKALRFHEGFMKDWRRVIPARVLFIFIHQERPSHQTQMHRCTDREADSAWEYGRTLSLHGSRPDIEAIERYWKFRMREHDENVHKTS